MSQIRKLSEGRSPRLNEGTKIIGVHEIPSRGQGPSVLSQHENQKHVDLRSGTSIEKVKVKGYTASSGKKVKGYTRNKPKRSR
jgi:hypothetical protein